MSDIRSIFHPELALEDHIEKVITFTNRQPEVLEKEAREYVITDNLDKEYSKLLRFFDDGQKGDRGAGECCVWLSGFYGSGKSSFAKYLGLCFDPSAETPSGHFADTFIPRFPSQPLQTEMKRMRKDYDIAVFLLDLAAQGNAGVAHTPISTQLFDLVCHRAGYAPDRKIAQLEAKLQMDDRLEEFREKATAQTGMPYGELVKLEALLMPTASQLAHEFYPDIWPEADSLQTMTMISTQTEDERVEQMLELVEKITGSRRVLFIIDEVGHFLRNNDTLINNLDGLAKNLKELGKGRAWMIATAQETLPKTGALYGLRDRFPIKIDLKASDIREITHKRLLRKSADGEATLQEVFSKSGQKLVSLTTLEEFKPGEDLDASSFVRFYPMLPQQFDVLIEAIRSLARLQGGIGLRSAIRCVQDLLVGDQGGGSGSAVIDRPVPELVTAADLYDVLEADITPLAKDIVLSVQRIGSVHGDGSMEHRVAKAIALLQQIDGFPISRKNLAALLYPKVGQDPIADQIGKAVAALISDPTIPVGETDGSVTFLSETVSRIDTDRAAIVTTGTHRATIQSQILKDLFIKPPSVMVSEARRVTSGIFLDDGGREQRLSNDEGDIRVVIRLVEESGLDAAKSELLTESLATPNASTIYLAAPRPPEITSLLGEIHKAEEIQRAYRHNADQEVQRYVSGQQQLQRTASIEVQEFLSSALHKGWLIFRGNPTAAAPLGKDHAESIRAQLKEAAEKVFNKFQLAAENVKGDVAENFLRVTDLTQITRERDPLKVVEIKGTNTEIDLSHGALQEIIGFLEKHSNPDGKRLFVEFTDAPYGWSKDTIRYLVAALFYAQKIKIRKEAQEVSVTGDIAFEAFKNNTSFNGTTILRNIIEIDDEVRQRAAERLGKLTGEAVLPLPQKISDVARTCLPKFIKEVEGLPLRAARLGLPAERVTRLQQGLNNALLGDASEAPSIFGAEESELFDDLVWAREVIKALDNGAEDTLSQIKEIMEDARGISSQGILSDLPEKLKEAGKESLQRVEAGTFHQDVPALNSALTELEKIVTEHCASQVETMRSDFAAQADSLRESTDYRALEPENKAAADNQLADLVFDCEPTIDSLRTANTKIVQLSGELNTIRQSIQAAKKPKEVKPEPDPVPAGATPVTIPGSIKTEPDLDAAIETLQSNRDKLPLQITTK